MTKFVVLSCSEDTFDLIVSSYLVLGSSERFVMEEDDVLQFVEENEHKAHLLSIEQMIQLLTNEHYLNSVHC